MAKSTITRRLFNKLVASISIYFKFKKPKKQNTEQSYMEVVQLPPEFIYPYSPKVREVLYNHLRSGKSRLEIKKWILSHSKVIKVPLK